MNQRYHGHDIHAYIHDDGQKYMHIIYLYTMHVQYNIFEQRTNYIMHCVRRIITVIIIYNHHHHHRLVLCCAQTACGIRIRSHIQTHTHTRINICTYVQIVHIAQMLTATHIYMNEHTPWYNKESDARSLLVYPYTQHTRQKTHIHVCQCLCVYIQNIFRTRRIYNNTTSTMTKRIYNIAYKLYSNNM